MKTLCCGLLVLFAVIFGACQKPKAKEVFDIRGTWYFEEWTLYHTLKFDGNQLVISNNIDSVMLVNYEVSLDSLYLSSPMGEKYTVHIGKLSADELILDHLPGIKGERTYTHHLQKWAK